MSCCTNRVKEDYDHYTVAEPLLDLETSSVVSDEAPVTTVTFFKGATADSVADVIRDRVRKLIKVNPWVAGRIVRDKNHENLQLHHPTSDAEVKDYTMADLVRIDPPDLMKFHPKTPYEELVTAILGSSANLPKLDKAMFGSDFESEVLVTRITLVSDPITPSDFALVFSMSHVIADGATYYQILNMLSSSAPITPLCATRNQGASAKIEEACGKEEYNFMFGSGLMGNAISGLAFGNKAKVFCHYVDDGRMAAAKAQAKDECKEQGVKFVSSNDVLVSTLSNVTGVRLWMMAMNFRGRLEGIDPTLAGNYESCIWLDEQVYSSPAKVRKLLQDGAPYKSHGLPLPTTWECLSSAKLGNCSNWASFSGEDIVVGAATQHLHLPLVPSDMIPFESVCFFRPRKGTLAVMILSKNFEREAFIEGVPLGADLFA